MNGPPEMLWHPRAMPKQPTRRRRRYCVLALTAALLVVGLAPARGHDIGYPRLIHVRFGPELVEIAIQTTLHAGAKAQALFDRHDLDDDGSLSEAEESALARTLDGLGRSRLGLEIDGVRLTPEVGRLALRMSEEDGVLGKTLALQSVAAVALVMGPGSHEVVVEDVPPSPRATVPVRVDAPGFTLSDGTVEGDTMPLQAMPQGWVSGFTGSGGTLRFSLTPDGSPSRK